MSRQASSGGPPGGGVSGFEALRRSPEFGGPVEPVEDPDHANDHLAVIYETEEERYAAVVPFIRQGLERNERCIYVVDDPSGEAEVVAALRAGGVDVESATESGALAFYTVEETYLRAEPFDPEAMVAFYDDAIDEALAEYEGLRVTSGTNWIDEVPLEAFMEYEGKVNRLFEERESMALCHYDRTRLRPEVIRDTIRTHPHLVYDGAVCHNVYYTPPEELTGPGSPEDDIDRLLGTVRDRARAKAEVAEHKRFLRELNEITASPGRSFEEKLEDLLDLGCSWFDLELGALNRVDPEADRLEVEYINGHHDYYQPGAEFPLSQTYCIAAADIREAATVSDPPREGYDDLAVYEEFGVESYLGTYVPVEGDEDRTFAFIASGTRAEPFTEEDRTYVELMGQWVKYELDRRQRVRELRERTEHLSALVETSPDCIKTVAADGTLLQMNPAGLEIGGADSESEVVGECVYDFVAPEHRERYRAFNERVCQGESGSLKFDVVGLEGTRRHLESHAAPLERPDGTTVQVAVTRDITDRVERAQKLEDTVDQLQQSNDRLKQFAYAASHDLQEPLRMVSSYLQLLEEELGEEVDDEAEEYIEFAVEGADRMRAMVEDLLAYSRVENDDGEREPVDCESLVERVTTDLRVQIEETDGEVVVGSLPTVEADREQVEQLFRNLLSNAIKYSGEEPPRVEVTAERRGNGYEFAVSDDGIGIPPEKTDRVFEVFKRLHHDDEYPGTGIGLSICQEIVDNHGGGIWLDSEPGEGSTFFFTLPGRPTA